MTPAAGAGTRPLAVEDRVDAWLVVLDPEAVLHASARLTEAERARAAGMRIGASSWMLARAALRGILGLYLELSPQAVPIVPGLRGKPSLAPGAARDVRFNLSHSDGLALVAVRAKYDVGADIEAIRPGIDGDAISREVFGDSEREYLARLAASGCRDAFLRTWVRHEALAKASAHGVASPGSPPDSNLWTARELVGIDGYLAAVASQGDAWSIRRHQWENHQAMAVLT